MKNISVNAQAHYIERESRPELDRYTFAYDITITNHSSETVQLLSRHWIIIDGNNKVEEVRGPGVVGETPHIAPGESYRYRSGAMLETPYGTMEGSYRFVDQHKQTFDIPIPLFRLAVKGILQ